MKEWKKGCDMKFHVGQKVMTVMGEGVVQEIKPKDNFPIIINLHGCFYNRYTIDGCISPNAVFPLIFPIELLPTFYQPQWQPKEEEWCWFWDESKRVPTIRRFKEIVDIGACAYKDESESIWTHCAPFDKDNMTPPWERGAEG